MAKNSHFWIFAKEKKTVIFQLHILGFMQKLGKSDERLSRILQTTSFCEYIGPKVQIWPVFFGKNDQIWKFKTRNGNILPNFCNPNFKHITFPKNLMRCSREKGLRLANRHTYILMQLLSSQWSVSWSRDQRPQFMSVEQIFKNFVF